MESSCSTALSRPLPNELLIRILHEVPTEGLNASRLADKRMCHAVNFVRSGRRKVKFALSLFLHAESKELMIELTRKCKGTSTVEPLSSFCFNVFHLIELSYVEIRDVLDESNAKLFLEYLNDIFELTDAGRYTEEFRLRDVSVAESASSELSLLFEAISDSIKHVNVSGCLLPCSIRPHIIERSEGLQTFKWIDNICPGEEEMAEAVALRLRKDLEGGSGHGWSIECTGLRVETTADILEIWRTMARPVSFSFVAHCSQEWESSFESLLVSRGINGFAYEYEHRHDKFAHIKVLTDSSTVRFLPVLDVPAKTQHNPHVSARWFRDFR